MHATPAQDASASATLLTEAYHEQIVDALSRLKEDNVDQIAIELMDEDEGLALQSENQLSVFVEIIHEMVRHSFSLMKSIQAFLTTPNKKILKFKQ